MNSDERSQLLKDLKRGRTAIAEALNGVDKEIARRKPAPGRWSILECVEHVATAERLMFSQTRAATFVPESRINLIREKAIRERGSDRSRHVDSPEAAKPAGRFSTLKEAEESFMLVRDSVIEFVKSCEEDLRFRLTEHPLMGSVNCYENLLIMAAHSLRHAKQILEIRELLNTAT